MTRAFGAGRSRWRSTGVPEPSTRKRTSSKQALDGTDFGGRALKINEAQDKPRNSAFGR